VTSQFTEVMRVGYFGRIRNAFFGVLFGLVLLVASVGVLLWLKLDQIAGLWLVDANNIRCSQFAPKPSPTQWLRLCCFTKIVLQEFRNPHTETCCQFVSRAGVLSCGLHNSPKDPSIQEIHVSRHATHRAIW